MQSSHNVRRLTVCQCLGTTIVCHDADGGETSLNIPEHYTDIVRLLAEGDVINVVGDDIIIYQPDYLVDISSVAACFESYADTPYISLLGKLKTVPPTRSILLGNLASQFLDEEVHGGNVGYAESITKYFHSHALDMAVADNIDASFHRDARQQKDNIRSAVHDTLEHQVEDYDPSQVLLEPSFFCEALGLQGRMDLLQRDYRVLIEQKSGKGGFPQSDPDTPVYLEKHYVQMLLYRAMLSLGYELDGKPVADKDIQSFLLYSKYGNGLVRLETSLPLLHRAIMLRNQIAYLELSYARGGADVLLTMKPEQLRRKPMSDKFWLTWVRPDIERVLSVIQSATPLEQAYFLRMFRFVAGEHMLSKMVRRNEKEENTGFAAKWHTSLVDKLMSGSIIHRLAISECIVEDGAITKVCLTSLPDAEVRSGNFRLGDIVTLYAYEEGKEPDIRSGIVHRGAIEALNASADGILTILIRLRSPQTTPLSGEVWAVEHDFYESSTTTLYRSLYQFLSASPERKALLLSQRQPAVDTSVTLKGDYGKFNGLVLGAMQAQDYYLVVGPPGTGKTSFALLNILKEQLLKNESVLLLAYTNRAVDEISSKLVEEGLDFIRLGSSLSCEQPYRKYLLENKTDACANVGEIRQLIADTPIFVGTTTATTSASSSLFRLKTFDLAIIDEASQILEPQLMGLLSSPSIRRFVLIGDHKQLPAVVQQSEEDSRVSEQCLLDIGLTNCRNSLFERLYNTVNVNVPVPVLYFLSKQGRMHGDIADFPSRAFYDGRLQVAGLPHQLESVEDKRVKFIAVKDNCSEVWDESDKVNLTEARIIAREVVKAIREAGNHFDPLTTVGVIVPYRSQIAAVRQELSKAIGQRSKVEGQLSTITIDTVERYQGSQRDVIIYGFTVRYDYQLRFLTSATFTDPISGALIDRRLNVALTRAKKKEIIVGNPDILCQAPVFRSLIEYCKEHYCYVEA